MTLGGMAAAVGLIIDDAIVMIEQIIRRVRQAGIAGASVLAAAAEFARRGSRVRASWLQLRSSPGRWLARVQRRS